MAGKKEGARAWVDFDAVKAAVSMSALLDRLEITGKLKAQNGRLVGKCPFHKGTNPRQFSVSVADGKGLFHCFAPNCGAKGAGPIDFVAQWEGITPREAALKLAEWFGVDSQRPTEPGADDKPAPAKAKPSAETLEVEEAGELADNKPLGWFYQSLEPEHAYLRSRGLAPETVAEFGKVKALRKGELVEAAGQLGYCSKGMQEGRVVIPIADPDGVLLAYAGRWAGDDSAIPEGQGKYLLPKAEHFRKSFAVFNLARAAAHAGPKRTVVVCEGYFSVLKLWEHGFRSCVALMGSSISERQAELIGTRFTGALVFLDGDATAAAEGVAGKLAARLWVKIVSCPAGAQPDTLAPHELKRLLA